MKFVKIILRIIRIGIGILFIVLSSLAALTSLLKQAGAHPAEMIGEWIVYIIIFIIGIVLVCVRGKQKEDVQPKHSCR